MFPQYHLVEGSPDDFVGKDDVLISESLARKLSVDGDNLIGKVINVDQSDRTIKGVFADFDGTFFMPYDIITHISGTWAAEQERNFGGVVTDFPARPASESSQNPNGGVIVTRAEELRNANCMLIGTSGEDKSHEDRILQAYREYRLETSGVEKPAWRYGFIKEINHKMLSPVQRTLRLVELFAVLAVLISLLGLLAMSTYFADENTKQIAVRKVFGSDVTHETWRKSPSGLKHKYFLS